MISGLNPAKPSVSPKFPRQLELAEWEILDVRLSAAELSCLLKCPAGVLQVQTLPGGASRLRAGAVVGQLRLGTVDLRILPKFPMPSLLAMLAEVHELTRFVPQLAGYNTSHEVIDLLVQIFLGQVERVVRQGLKRAYIEEDEDLIAVRGRIDLARTLENHLRGQAKVRCRYEEYTLDGPENRVLLAALRLIAGAASLPLIRRNVAHRIAAEFVGVRAELYRPTELSLSAYDRLNQHYHPAVPLAELILKSAGLALELGMVEADGFLLDMNQLFEKFVHRKLRGLLAPDGIQVRAQTIHAFDAQKQSKLRPDLLIQARHGQRIVADTKYKLGTKPDPGDLYQMLTYCRVLNVANGVLFTVGVGSERRYEVLDGATTITVIPVNLGGNLADVERSFTELADGVRALLKRERHHNSAEAGRVRINSELAEMENAQRQALRVLQMVHELHKQGYQLLRIAPGMSASGCHWRAAVTQRANIQRDHGAMLADCDTPAAHYTSGQEDKYFGWTDAQRDDTSELARKFVERFPEVVDGARGEDWNYAGWYVRMLGYAERGMFPIAYADWYEPQNPRFLPLSGHESDLPMPPPGDAEPEKEVS